MKRQRFLFEEARPVALVSGCLVGLTCRWHGRQTPIREFARRLVACGVVLVPICPEQLGGLPTPRSGEYLPEGVTGADVLDGRARILTPDNHDVTENYIRGAKATLTIAQLCGAKTAYLKSGSPSCGESGVATTLLTRHGLNIIHIA